MKKCLFLDIETQNLDMESEGLAFDNPKGWKTACVGIYDLWEGEPYDKGVSYFFVPDANHIYDKSMRKYNLWNLETLEQTLTKCYESGYYLVTKNGKGFDLPILSKSLEEGGASVKDIIDKYEGDNRHIDICALLREQYGYRFSLQNLVNGLYGSNESKTMAAAEAPKAWDRGEHREVLDYCIYDCILTAKVFFDAPQQTFEAVGYNGKRRKKMIVKANW